MPRATKKNKWFSDAKLKIKALRHFKFDPVLKIDATFHSHLDL